MLRFKIGDEVIANHTATEEYEYTITKPGWKGKVIDVAVDGDPDMIQVEGKNDRGEIDDYPVNQNAFDLIHSTTGNMPETPQISDIAKQLKRKGPKKPFKITFKFNLDAEGVDEEHASEEAYKNLERAFPGINTDRFTITDILEVI